MKKLIKLLPLIIGSMTIAGCNATISTTQAPSTSDFSFSETHHAKKKTYHIGTRDVKDTNIIFAESGQSDYEIVYKNTGDKKTTEAVSYFNSQIGIALGSSLKYAENPTYDANKKYIVINDKEMFDQAGLKMPSDIDIKDTGYVLKRAGNSLFLFANAHGGYYVGVNALLKHLVGKDTLSMNYTIYVKNDVEVNSTSTVYLPDCDIVEVPDYDVRINSNSISFTDNYYSMDYSNSLSTFFIAVGGQQYHNSFKFVPPENHLVTHPKWFSTSKSYNQAQLCYTARGDKAEYDALIDEISNRIIYFADQKPELNYINFGQEDVNIHCECEACLKAEKDSYGWSGAVIKFINNVDDALQAKLQARADKNNEEKRDLTLTFFAYQTTLDAPSKYDDSVKCNDNVGVIIAPVRADWTDSFYEESNEEWAENVTRWSQFCNKIVIWAYQTNFASFFFPYNSWDSVIEDYRFFLDCNAFAMNNEGNWCDTQVTGFTRFKDYIDSKSLIDVSVTTTELYEKFFKYYYGDGGLYMRQFFDEVIDHLRILETKFEGTITGNINKETYEKSDYWPLRLLKSWNEMCDNALDAISPQKIMNPKLYEILYQHITLDAFFPKYAMCSLYENSFNRDELEDLREQVVEIAKANNIKWRNEPDVGKGVTLEDLFASWGY